MVIELYEIEPGIDDLPSVEKDSQPRKLTILRGSSIGPSTNVRDHTICVRRGTHAALRPAVSRMLLSFLP